MIQLKFLPNKEILTWTVITNTAQIFFTRKNGCTFEHPYKRALRVYEKLKRQEENESTSNPMEK